MNLYVVELGMWRLAKKEKIPIHDTTQITGRMSVLKPSSALFNKYLTKEITGEDFVLGYRGELSSSYLTNKQAWLSILGNQRLALASKSNPESKVYIAVLAKFIEEVCAIQHIPFTFMGKVH